MQTHSTNLTQVAGLVINYVSSLLTPAVIISFLPVHAVIRLSQKPLNDCIASSQTGTLPLYMHFSSLNESFGTGCGDEMNIFDVEAGCCLQQLVETNTHTR